MSEDTEQVIFTASDLQFSQLLCICFKLAGLVLLLPLELAFYG